MSLLSCPRALDRFACFLDGELGVEDGRPLEDHLETCGSCREQARDMARVHRDLAMRSAREERDPIPALLARVRWDAAAAHRPRRARAFAQDRADSWIFAAAAASIVACLLLAFVGIERTSSPRRFARVEPAPPLKLPVPRDIRPDPAPRIPNPPATEPETWTPRPTPAPVAAPERPAPMPEPEPPPPSIRPTTSEAPPAVARVASTGKPISIGETLVADGPVVVVYPDGTRLCLAHDTSITFGGRGKTISVGKGEVAADVTPQPRDEPMIFVTAGAEVRVVGTYLTVASRPESTLVTVEKGRVQVTRKSDHWSIPVREGQYAAVEPGRLPIARPLPDNSASDPGFEADGRGWGGIRNKALGRNYGGVSATADVVRSGARAVQLFTTSTPGFDREVFQDVPVAPGETIEASGWIRTAGLGGPGVRLSILWLGAGSFFDDLTTVVRSRGMVIREDVVGTLTGTNDWTRLAARLVAPLQAKQVRLLVYVDSDPGGPAAAWIDDLILRRYPKSR